MMSISNEEKFLRLVCGRPVEVVCGSLGVSIFKWEMSDELRRRSWLQPW